MREALGLSIRSPHKNPISEIERTFHFHKQRKDTLAEFELGKVPVSFVSIRTRVRAVPSLPRLFPPVFGWLTSFFLMWPKCGVEFSFASSTSSNGRMGLSVVSSERLLGCSTYAMVVEMTVLSKPASPFRPCKVCELPVFK